MAVAKTFFITRYWLDVSTPVIGLRYNMETRSRFGDPESIRSDSEFVNTLKGVRARRPHILLLNSPGITEEIAQRLLDNTLITLSDLFREHFRTVWIQCADHSGVRAAWVAPALHPTEVVERPVQVGDRRAFSDFKVGNEIW